MPKIVAKLIDTDEAELWHVKLDKPRIARRVAADGGRGSFVEVDHVLVGVSSLTKEDKHGRFHYTETAVVGTDETGKHEPVFVYLTPSALTLEEVLWIIGEPFEKEGVTA